MLCDARVIIYGCRELGNSNGSRAYKYPEGLRYNAVLCRTPQACIYDAAAPANNQLQPNYLSIEKLTRIVGKCIAQ